MANDDWVVREDGWVHKEELKRWPVEEIDPELWAAICKEFPDKSDSWKYNCFWSVRDFREFEKRVKKT